MDTLIKPNLANLIPLFDYLPDAIFLIDPKTSNIVWCNVRAYKTLGYEPDELLNHSVLSLQKDVSGLTQWHAIAEVIRSTENYTFIGRHLRKDGSEILVEVMTNSLKLDHQDYFVSSARTIEKRIANHNELLTHRDSIWLALNEASDGTWEWEISTGKVFFSPQLKRLLGYGPDEMEERITTWTENIHPDDRAYVTKVLNKHLHDKRTKYEADYRLKNRNGHYIWIHDRGQIFKWDENGNPTHAVGMVQNITDQKFMQFQLEELAANDMLTNLPNRREGEKQARHQVALSKRNNQPMCLAIIDLDHFKNINDLFGHKKGDDVLIYVANLFLQTLRTTDFVCRWGGEEFVIVLPNTDQEQAKQVSDKLHETFKKAAWENLGVTPMCFCMGIACYPYFEANFDELLNHADTAVYQAKELGRSQTVFAHN